MGCCSWIGQYLLFLVNLGFAIVGLALIVVGAVYKYQFDSILEVLPDDVSSLSLTPILSIVVGCIIFVIAFFGCCGAVKQGTCMLSTYSVLVFVILIFQVAVGIYAFVQFSENQESFKEHIFTQLNSSFSNYNKNDALAEAVDFLQSELECCGVTQTSDWDSITNGTLPSSCCSSLPTQCPSSDAYDTGCAEALWSWLQRNANNIGIVAIVIAAVELLGGLVAVCQIRSINRRYHV